MTDVILLYTRERHGEKPYFRIFFFSFTLAQTGCLRRRGAEEEEGEAAARG